MKVFRYFPFFAAVIGIGLSAQDAMPGSPSFRGITEPFNSSTISSTVSGRIASIRKKEGEFVRKGEIILELEKEAEELEAALRKLVAESKVEAVSATYKDSILKLDYESTRQLFESTKSISQEELLKKELEYKVARAESDRLAMQEKKEDLEYRISLAHLKKRVITAPFDGQVVKIHLKLAESCNPQEPLVRVADVSRCRFISHVQAVASASLSAGLKMTLSFPGGPVQIQKEGIIEFVSPVIDPSSGLREVNVLFDNTDKKVKPGSSGTMALAGTP